MKKIIAVIFVLAFCFSACTIKYIDHATIENCNDCSVDTAVQVEK